MVSPICMIFCHLMRHRPCRDNDTYMRENWIWRIYVRTFFSILVAPSHIMMLSYYINYFVSYKGKCVSNLVWMRARCCIWKTIYLGERLRIKRFIKIYTKDWKTLKWIENENLKLFHLLRALIFRSLNKWDIFGWIKDFFF